ncbi:MAG: Kelch repeat-containing protein [Myxococcales bacterium]
MKVHLLAFGFVAVFAACGTSQSPTGGSTTGSPSPGTTGASTAGRTGGSVSSSGSGGSLGGTGTGSTGSLGGTGTTGAGTGSGSSTGGSTGSSCVGGSCTPSNVCDLGTLSCSTGVAVCQDTGQPNAARNGTGCASGAVCNAGQCTACSQGGFCWPANVCDLGSTDCSTGVAVCQDTGQPDVSNNGLDCGSGKVCSNGACTACSQGGSCAPANPCDQGTLDCSTGVPACTDTGSPNAAANGAPCNNGNGVCDNGACASCSQGAGCTPANTCDLGAIDCGTGAPVCNDTGSANPAANGSPCGTGSGTVCDNGVCASCSQGAGCTPTNACDLGAIDCSTGAPVCNDTGSANPAANGSPCGTGSGTVCDNGGCVSCSQGAACTPANSCDLGTIDCSTGAPVCRDTGSANTAANGNPCGSAGGAVCDNGGCDPGCWISGALIAGGTAAPGNSCETCQPAVSTSGYSKVPDGTTCGLAGSGETCTGGACGCLGGKALCGTTCVDLSTDAQNCGHCSTACGAATSCFGGSCSTAAPLPSGQFGVGCATSPAGVLYCLGGTGSGTPSAPGGANAELYAYDSTANQWTIEVPALYPLEFDPPAFTGTGALLAVGEEGDLTSIAASATAETQTYTPGSGWSQAYSVAFCSSPVVGFASAAGLDGKVYVFGGFDSNGNGLSGVEIYDPKANQWSSVGAGNQLPTPRGLAAAVTASDGTIWVIGGMVSWPGGAVSAEVDGFDPATLGWVSGAALPAARAGHSAALGGDGRIYAAGDLASDTNALAWIPGSAGWTAIAPTNTGRAYPGMAADASGRVYVIGGYSPASGALSSVEVYTPGIDAWVP